MKIVPALTLLCVAACASGPEPRSFPEAQAMVDAVAARHGDVVRLTIHAVPSDGDRARVIASTSADKLGKWSDPEDLEALDNAVPITLMEGDDLDYTAPVVGAGGEPIAAVGVTVSGTDEGAMKASATAIAAELADAIRAAPTLPW